MSVRFGSVFCSSVSVRRQLGSVRFGYSRGMGWFDFGLIKINRAGLYSTSARCGKVGKQRESGNRQVIRNRGVVRLVNE